MNKNIKKGFTLVEMMIVVAIIAVLAGVAIPQYSKYVKKAEASEALQFMKQIVNGEVDYYSTHGKYIAMDTNDTGSKVIGFSAPSNSDFKYFKAEVCANESGILMSASTESTYGTGTTVYSYYPKNIKLDNDSAVTNIYSAGSYLGDYINNSPTRTIEPDCS